VWLFTDFGFFSVVQKPSEADLTVRARVRADLDELRDRYLPELGETRTGEGTDYPFRASVTHQALGHALERIARDVDYSNFKGRVSIVQGHGRAKIYGGVWTELLQLEKQASARKTKGKARGRSSDKGAKQKRKGSKRSAEAYGGVVFDGYGRILLREPTNHYGDYVWTFAKGGQRPEDRSPEDAALREVLEETGVEAVIEAPIEGRFGGDTSVTIFWLMMAVRVAGEPKPKETQQVRWVTRDEAPALIGQTITPKGRQRDLDVLRAALELYDQLKSSGRLDPQVPERPRQLAGLCTCVLPLPPRCPMVEVAGTCDGCPVAASQDCAAHTEIADDDPRLASVIDELVTRIVADEEQRRSIAAYARELYVRDDHAGTALPKTVVFSVYKHGQMSGSPVRLTDWGHRLFAGDEVERWPHGSKTKGPRALEMFEEYSKRYQFPDWM